MSFKKVTPSTLRDELNERISNVSAINKTIDKVKNTLKKYKGHTSDKNLLSNFLANSTTYMTDLKDMETYMNRLDGTVKDSLKDKYINPEYKKPYKQLQNDIDQYKNKIKSTIKELESTQKNLRKKGIEPSTNPPRPYDFIKTPDANNIPSTANNVPITADNVPSAESKYPTVGTRIETEYNPSMIQETSAPPQDNEINSNKKANILDSVRSKFDNFMEKAKEDKDAKMEQEPPKSDDTPDPKISVEKQRAITLTIMAIYQMIVSLYTQVTKAPLAVSILTISSFGMILFTGLLAVIYGLRIISNYADNKLINNPTNDRSLDFLLSNFGNTASSSPLLNNVFGSLFANMTSGSYKFGLFLILPWITVTLAVLGIYFSIKKESEGQATGGAVKAILYACLVHGLIALFLNYTVFFYAYKMIKMTSFRINAFNNHVLTNMIQKADFLGELQKIPTNTFATLDIVKSAISKLFADNVATQGAIRAPSQTDLGKAMFTLNMYMHFQELGFRNPALYDAIGSFRMYSFILSKQNFQPANYLRRKSTFVRDNTELYRQILENILKDKSEVQPDKNGPAIEKSKYINRAIIMSSRATAEANNLANVFYPEDAMIRVLRMAVILIMVQWLPVLIAMWIFRDPNVRAGFRDAINMIMKK